MAGISVSRIAQKELGARWGHEWAAVAYMACMEKRAGEAWTWLSNVRKEWHQFSDGERDEFIEWLPEDLMKVLAIGEELG